MSEVILTPEEKAAVEKADAEAEVIEAERRKNAKLFNIQELLDLPEIREVYVPEFDRRILVCKLTGSEMLEIRKKYPANTEDTAFKQSIELLYQRMHKADVTVTREKLLALSGEEQTALFKASNSVFGFLPQTKPAPKP